MTQIPRILAILTFALFTVSCETVQHVLYNKGTEAYDAGDFTEAFKHFSIVVEDDSYPYVAALRFQLAGMYTEGKGVAKDIAKAIYWYERIARGNSKKKLAKSCSVPTGPNLSEGRRCSH